MFGTLRSSSVPISLQGFTSFSALLNSTATFSMLQFMPPPDSYIEVFERLATCLSFVCTPVVTSKNLKIYYNKMYELDKDLGMRLQLGTMFEIANAVWCPQTTWEILERKYEIKKPVKNMTQVEYLLYCTENLDSLYQDTYSSEGMDLPRRNFISAEMLGTAMSAVTLCTGQVNTTCGTCYNFSEFLTMGRKIQKYN